ncbi:hypothetical protein EWM64_g7007, partial [Hericium alpestre]
MEDPVRFIPQQWGATMVNRSSLASLAFLVWDILITLDDEIRCIWSKPNRFWTKWLFLFVRYFAVAIQVATLFVGTEIAVELHYAYHSCVSWYIFQEVSTQILIISVELILMIRVHALYDRNYIITAILFALFLVENITMIITLVHVVPGVQFDEACVVLHTPGSLIYFGVAYVAFETILFGLTLVKFVQAVRRGWGRTPVVTVLMRDGTWAFALVFVVVVINGLFYIGLDGSISAVAYAFVPIVSLMPFPTHIIYLIRWILSLESFAGCHLILNLQTLDHPDPRSTTTMSSHIEFSTNLEAHTTGTGTFRAMSDRPLPPRGPTRGGVFSFLHDSG